MSHTIIDSDFLKTGAQWDLSELTEMQYSFISSLPAYYTLNPLLGTAHAFLFEPATGSFFTSNSDPDFIDQQDVARFILDDPSQLPSYKNEQTVNTILVNSVDYRVSFSDVIDASDPAPENRSMF